MAMDFGTIGMFLSFGVNLEWFRHEVKKCSLCQ